MLCKRKKEKGRKDYDFPIHFGLGSFKENIIPSTPLPLSLTLSLYIYIYIYISYLSDNGLILQILPSCLLHRSFMISSIDIYKYYYPYCSVFISYFSFFRLFCLFIFFFIFSIYFVYLFILYILFSLFILFYLFI